MEQRPSLSVSRRAGRGTPVNLASPRAAARLGKGSGASRAVARDLGQPLARAFYGRNTLAVARQLLGRLLVFEGPEGRVSGIIVETEAYRGAEDAASHGHRRETARNAVMFGPPGHAYIYFVYGMHFCLNVVTERRSVPGAVLLRAIDPEGGIDLMRARRGPLAPERLARGPGNLARALGLTRSHDGLDLVRGPLWISDRRPRRARRAIVAGPRVGIRVAVDLPWRFYLAGHPAVSPAPKPGPRTQAARGRTTGTRRSALTPP